MFQGRNRYMFSYKKKRRAETLKRILRIIIFAAVLLLGLFIALTIYTSRAHINTSSDLTVEINSQAKASDFINSISNGTLVNDVDIDTSTLGRKEIPILVNVDGKEKEYLLTLEVVDTEPPEMTLPPDGANVLIGTELNVIGKGEALDNSGETVNVKIDGEYDPNRQGAQTIKYTAMDSAGNLAESEITVNVIDIKEGMGDITFLTRTGKTAEIKDGVLYVDGNLIVNKAFPLPPAYGAGLTEETLNAWVALLTKAEEDGIYLQSGSDFVSYDDQADVFYYYSVYLGEGDDTTSTEQAGYSEHQSGLAIDVISYYANFENTPEGIWINEHCKDFGFIVRYPADKEKSTGHVAVPWHLRYVGRDLAEALNNNGTWITLEEYYGIPGDLG